MICLAHGKSRQGSAAEIMKREADKRRALANHLSRDHRRTSMPALSQ
jgi:hypothetical protein